MFVKATIVALAAAQLSVPLGRPRVIEQPRAPIEVAGPQFATACKDADGSEKYWDTPAPPVRIHGNTYLVGTCGISAILITGNSGHVLIDSGTEAGADLIIANVRRLGFRPGDVRILLHSHEHIDHVGGMARLQQLTGASLVASPAATSVLQSGTPGSADPQAGVFPPFRAVQVDRVLRDDEEVRLGNLALMAVATPGHSPGALSWHWGSCDGGVCRRIVYADSLSPISREGYRFSEDPAYLDAYRRSIEKVGRLECDILLTPHPSASNLANRIAGNAPLTNPAACRDYAAAKNKALEERLAEEVASK